MNSTRLLDRCFLRHPSDIPIEIAAEVGRPDALPRLKDIGLGGLAGRSSCPLQVGGTALLTIALCAARFPTLEGYSTH